MCVNANCVISILWTELLGWLMVQQTSVGMVKNIISGSEVHFTSLFTRLELPISTE